MKQLRKIIIASTSVRTFVVRHAESSNFWCPVCRTYELMVSPAAAAVASGQSVRTIFRWLEAGKLHYNEDDAGLLICFASLCIEETEELNWR